MSMLERACQTGLEKRFILDLKSNKYVFEPAIISGHAINKFKDKL